MIKERSAGGIIINKEGNILVIKHNKGHWSFPKGHLEKGETDIQAAIREIKEETNIDVKIHEEINETETYSPKEGIIKDVIFFLSYPLTNDVKLQEIEVCDYKWASLNEVLNTLTYDRDKEILKNIYNKYQKLFK